LDDRQHLAALYARFGPVVYRRCLRLLRDPEDARDATQQIFIRLLRSPRRFEDLDDALPWIHTVTTNHCFNWKRDARRYGGQLDALGSEPEEHGELGDRAEARQLTGQVLSRADAQSREIAVGMLVKEEQQQQVAQRLGVSEKTVQRKLKTFLQNARRFLDRSDS
jgi:RNA polymerase sigma-70 factor (ECF subfamily)